MKKQNKSSLQSVLGSVTGPLAPSPFAKPSAKEGKAKTFSIHGGARGTKPSSSR